MYDRDRNVEPDTAITDESATDLYTTDIPAYDLQPLTRAQYSSSAMPEAKTTSDEPTSQKELASPELNQWFQGIQGEFQNLQRNGTWKLGKPPLGVRPLQPGIILKLKHDSSGRPARYNGIVVSRANFESD